MVRDHFMQYKTSVSEQKEKALKKVPFRLEDAYNMDTMLFFVKPFHLSFHAMTLIFHSKMNFLDMGLISDDEFRTMRDKLIEKYKPFIGEL